MRVLYTKQMKNKALAEITVGSTLNVTGIYRNWYLRQLKKSVKPHPIWSNRNKSLLQGNKRTIDC